jgi:hypothetical protein
VYHGKNAVWGRRERVIAAAVAPTTWKRVADITTEITRGFKGNSGRKKADAKMRFDRRLNDLCPQ